VTAVLPPPTTLGFPCDDDDFPDAQPGHDCQTRSGVGDSNLPQPNPQPLANRCPAAAPNLPDAYSTVDSQGASGVGDQTTETAQVLAASQLKTGGFGSDSEDGAGAQGHADSHSTTGLGPILADPTLAMCADVLDDLEVVRNANANRLRALTAPIDQVDKDGKSRGMGLTLAHPDVVRLAALVKLLEDGYHDAELNLKRVMRHHPLGPWVKAQKGIGEKQAARLLASIRDPYWNDLHDRPRTVRELYRFCGMDVVGTSAQDSVGSHTALGAGVAPTKQRGERVHWSPDARMRLWLVAESCIKQMESPYRAVYDAGRAKYAEAVHQQDCKRCGPKGHPAPAGSPLSAGHQHARSQRLMMKAILKDLWTEAKRLHESQP
jgi:hypothetical protein